jgi:hypothetical protein
LVVFALAYLNRKKIKRVFCRAVIGFWGETYGGETCGY